MVITESLKLEPGSRTAGARVEYGNSSQKESNSLLQRPLLKPKTSDSKRPSLSRTTTLKIESNVEHLHLRKSPLFIIITAALRTASRLSSLLPTAVFLVFQVLTPLLTNGGHCDESKVYEVLAIVELGCCFLLCLIASLTDSFTASNGEVHHGLITPRGLWTPHISEAASPALQDKYMLTWTDLIYAVLSLSVFAVLALLDRNIRYCLYPDLLSDLLSAVLTLVLGFSISLVFMFFPTKRRGIGFLVVGESFAEVRVDGVHSFEAEAPPADVSQHIAKVLAVVTDNLDDAVHSD